MALLHPSQAGRAHHHLSKTTQPLGGRAGTLAATTQAVGGSPALRGLPAPSEFLGECPRHPQGLFDPEIPWPGSQAQRIMGEG